MLRELASRNVESIPRTGSLRECAQRMSERAVGSLIVNDTDGRIVGIVTDRDLLVRGVGRDGVDGDTPVETVMTPEPITIDGSADLDGAITLMGRHGIRRIPVVEDGVAVAIIALDDALEGCLHETMDLAREARSQVRAARRRAQLEHWRDEVETGLEQARQRARRLSWSARATFLDELDDLRASVRRLFEDD